MFYKPHPLMGTCTCTAPPANIFKVTEEAAKYRRKRKGVVETFPLDDGKNRKSELIATHHEDVRTNASLSFLRVHKHAKAWEENFKAQRQQRAVVVRSAQAIQRLKAHEQAVREGRATESGAIQAVYGKTVVDGTF